MNKIFFALTIAACCILPLGGAWSYNWTDNDVVRRLGCADEPSDCVADIINCVEIGLHAGKMWGKAFERVFDDNNQLVSELKWPIEDLYIIGGSLQVEFCKRFSLQAFLWTKITADDVIMTDKDFFPPFGLIVFSESPTTLHIARGYDFNFGYDFFRWGWCDSWMLSSKFMLGYLYSEWLWKASGGFLDVVIDPSLSFELPNRPVAQYKQFLRVPYIGLGLRVDGPCDAFSFGVEGRYSPVAQAFDRDKHFLRHIVFQDRFKNANYWSAGAYFERYFCNCFKVSAAYLYQRFERKHGDIKIVDKTTDSALFVPGAAGIENFTHCIELGIYYSF